jgi:hypothetical protein
MAGSWVSSILERLFHEKDEQLGLGTCHRIVNYSDTCNQKLGSLSLAHDLPTRPFLPSHFGSTTHETIARELFA